MPHCRHCGNSVSIASSVFKPADKNANVLPYGLVATFNHEGELSTMECQGATLNEAQMAYEDPEHYFDICPTCGSKDIEW